MRVIVCSHDRSVCIGQISRNHTFQWHPTVVPIGSTPRQALGGFWKLIRYTHQAWLIIAKAWATSHIENKLSTDFQQPRPVQQMNVHMHQYCFNWFSIQVRLILLIWGRSFGRSLVAASGSKLILNSTPTLSTTTTVAVRCPFSSRSVGTFCKAFHDSRKGAQRRNTYSSGRWTIVTGARKWKPSPLSLVYFSNMSRTLVFKL